MPSNLFELYDEAEGDLYYVGDRGPYYLERTRPYVSSDPADEEVTEDAPADDTLLKSFRATEQMQIETAPDEAQKVVRLEDLGPFSTSITFLSNYPPDAVQIGGANLLWTNDLLSLLLPTAEAQQWTACHPSAILVGDATLQWNYATSSLEIWIGGTVVHEWGGIAVTQPDVIWTYDAGALLKIGWAWFTWNATSNELELWANGGVMQSWGG